MFTRSKSRIHPIVWLVALALLVGAYSVPFAAAASRSTAGPSPNTIVSNDGLRFTAEEFLQLNNGASLPPTSAGAVGSADFAPDLSLATTDSADWDSFEQPLMPGLDSVIGPDGRTRVTTTTTYPYRAIAKLSIKYPGSSSTYGCTGWFISPRVLATAGHCVYDSSKGGWASSITAYPGKNGSSNPYGSSTGHRFFSVTGWTEDGNWNYDYGAIQLNSALGDTVGWFGFRWQSSNTFSGQYTVTGYPCDKPSGTMWKMSDNPGIKGVNTYHLFYAIDTYGCQSGSPVYHYYSSSCSAGGVDSCGVAIHSYGTGQSPYPQYNSGTRIREAVYNNLQSWKNYPYP